MRTIALVVLFSGKQITIVTDANESVEAHLNKKSIDWYKYRII
jgi:hypothetical protein